MISCGSSSRLLAAQQAADPGDPRVVGDLEGGLVELREVDQLPQPLLGVGDHRAELEHRERLAVLADPALAEEDRPPGVEQDRQRDHGQQRREQDQQQAGDEDVHRPLHRHRRPRRVAEAEVEHRQLGQPVELDPAPEQAVVLGQEGQRQALRLALLDQPLGRGSPISSSVTTTRSIACSRATREMSATEPSQGSSAGLGSLCGERYPTSARRVSGWVATRRATMSTASGGPITIPFAIAGQPVPEEAQDAAQDEAAGQRADPD